MVSVAAVGVPPEPFCDELELKVTPPQPEKNVTRHPASTARTLRRRSLFVEKDKSRDKALERECLRIIGLPCCSLAGCVAHIWPDRRRTSHWYIYFSSAGACAPLLERPGHSRYLLADKKRIYKSCSTTTVTWNFVNGSPEVQRTSDTQVCALTPPFPSPKPSRLADGSRQESPGA